MMPEEISGNEVVVKKKLDKLGIFSIFFGLTGFFPLIFIGSFIGIILAVVGLIRDKNKLLKFIGLGISIATLGLWIYTLMTF